MAPPPPVLPPGYPAPPAYPPGYPYPYPVYSPPTDGRATTSLVLGLVGLAGVWCCGLPAVVLGPLAIYYGRSSAARIQASGGALGGHGIATAGWVTGIVATALGGLYLAFWLLYFLVYVGLFGLFGILAAFGPHPTPTPS